MAKNQKPNAEKEVAKEHELKESAAGGHKEITKADAEAEAKLLKDKDACVQGILEETSKLIHGETHSVQQLMAYGRQLEKYSKK